MALAINGHNQRSSGPPIKIIILDTHDPNVVSVLTEKYKGTIISDQARPTPQVLQTPLNLHYQKDQRFTVIALPVKN